MSAEAQDPGDGTPQTVLSSDFKRLQKIEEHVLSCTELAADLMDELAKIGQADKMRAHTICKEFMANIQAAQDLIVNAVEQHRGPRQFEVTNYPTLAKGYVLAEKVRVLQLHLKEMDNWLSTES